MKNNERLITLEGAYNLRDVGGYKTRQGSTVKWGMMYRGGELHTLTPGDVKIMESRNIRTIIDFRSDHERAEYPDAAIPTVVNQVELPINAGNMIEMQNLPVINDGREIMKELGRLLVRYSTDVYTAFFEVLSDKKNAPVLFHCSAGKDRTGFGAALFLAALGVDRETIIEDYMLSAEYLQGKYDDIIAADPFMAPMMTVRPEYLEASLGVVDTEFGGMETYLKKTLGVDMDLLKSIYTE